MFATNTFNLAETRVEVYVHKVAIGLPIIHPLDILVITFLT